MWAFAGLRLCLYCVLNAAVINKIYKKFLFQIYWLSYMHVSDGFADITWLDCVYVFRPNFLI